MVQTKVEAAARKKTCRLRKIAEDPTFLEKEREQGKKSRAKPGAKEKRRKRAVTPKAKKKERKRQKKYRAKPGAKEKARDASFKQIHGVTRAEADAMIEAQGGLCAICKQPPNGRKSRARLNVDHDHKTSKVREMLCGRCNSGIGYAKEDPNLMRAWANYIEKHSSG